MKKKERQKRVRVKIKPVKEKTVKVNKFPNLVTDGKSKTGE